MSVCIDEVISWMTASRLQLNKTEVLWCSSCRRQHQIPAGPTRGCSTSVSVTSGSTSTLTSPWVPTLLQLSQPVSQHCGLRQIRSERCSLTHDAFVDADPCTGYHETRLLLFGVGRCACIADATATVCIERRRSTSLLSKEIRAHNSTPPSTHWLKVPEIIQYQLCVLAHHYLRGRRHHTWLSMHLTTDVDARQRLWSASTSTLFVTVHTWLLHIFNGCCSCLEQSVIWCQIYDVLGCVPSATQDRALRGVLWITGQLPPFRTVWPHAATFSLYCNN